MKNIRQKQDDFKLLNFESFKIKSFRDVRAISRVNYKDKFVGIPLIGDSLNNLGIFHGDILVTKLTDKFHEDKLCIWQTPHGRTAKFAYEDFGEITLHNKKDWLQRWNKSEVKCLGLVVRVERDLEVINENNS